MASSAFPDHRKNSTSSPFSFGRRTSSDPTSGTPKVVSPTRECAPGPSDPFESCCCELRYNEGQPDPRCGSGVLAQIPELRDLSSSDIKQRFPGLWKVADRISGSIYVLIVSHHTVPGLAYTKGWNLYSPLWQGKTKRLDTIATTAAVSCCGADSMVFEYREGSVLQEHPNEYCELKLDFTVLFLNANFMSFMTSALKNGLALPEISLRTEDLVSHKQFLVSLSQKAAASPKKSSPPPLTESANVTLRHWQQENCRSIESTIVDLHVRIPAIIEPCGLREEVIEHKKLEKFNYTCRTTAFQNHVITDGFSGSPIGYHFSGSSDGQLLGIHMGKNEEEGKEQLEGGPTYIAVSLYGIVQLMRGDIVACLSFMRYPQPRRLMPTQWTGIFQCYFDKHPRLSLQHLLHILDLLLEQHKGSTLVSLRHTVDREDKVATLNLLSALFRQFKYYSKTEIEQEIDGTENTPVDENRQVVFKTNIEELCQGLVDHLTRVAYDRDVQREQKVVEACFQCWSSVLNFTYKDIVCRILTSGNSLSQLGYLRDKYSESLRIQTCFGDIHKICRLYFQTKGRVELDRLEETKKQLTAKVALSEEQVRQLKDKLQRKEQDYDLLTEEKQAAVASSVRKDNELQTLRREQQTAVKALHEQNRAIRAEKAAAEASTQQKDEQLQVMQQERDEHIERASDLDEQLQTAQREREEQIQMVKDLEEQLRTREVKEMATKSAHQAMEQDNRRMSQQIETLEDHKRRLSGVNSKLQDENRQLQQNVAQLEEGKAKAENQSQQSSQKLASLRALSKQLEGNVQRLTDEKEAAEYRAEHHAESMTKLKKENTELGKRAHSFSQQVDMLRQEKSEREHELKTTKEELSSAHHELERLRKNKEQELELETTKQELRSARQELERLTQLLAAQDTSTGDTASEQTPAEHDET